MEFLIKNICYFYEEVDGITVGIQNFSVVKMSMERKKWGKGKMPLGDWG